MIRFLLLFLLSLSSLGSYVYAQLTPCTSDRYFEELFSEVDITLAQPFGQATTLSGTSKTLLMDLYEPRNDTARSRAAIILAHGGSFFTGSRFDMGESCLAFAKKGYVCASIDYRLIDGLVLDSIAITEAVLMSVSDMKAAIRFFKEDADKTNLYRVNPSQIIIGGVSAGAILANHAAYLDPQDTIPTYVQTILDKHGGFQGNSSENLQYDHEVMGVINYSGALLRDHWIQADEPPIFSVHEEFDLIVPCRYARTAAVPFPVFLYGSCVLDQQAQAVGIDQAFVFFENSPNHVAYQEGELLQNIIDQTSGFFREQLCQLTTSLPQTQPQLASIYPNPSRGALYLEMSQALPTQLSLYNTQGVKVWEQRTTASQRFNFAHLPAGAYIVELRQGIHIQRINWVRLP